MKKRKLLKIILLIVLTVGIAVGAYLIYLFNMPHRDVQNTETDFKVEASTLVKEYLLDSKTADDKYLDEEGDSKIFEVTGLVSEITEDFNGQKVLLLKSETDKAGVSCTFMKTTNKDAGLIEIGQNVKVKGVIRSGASYDSDMEMYENVIIEKCSIVK